MLDAAGPMAGRWTQLPRHRPAQKMPPSPRASDRRNRRPTKPRTVLSRYAAHASFHLSSALMSDGRTLAVLQGSRRRKEATRQVDAVDGAHAHVRVLEIYEFKQQQCDAHSCVARNVEIVNACVRGDMSCEQSLLSRMLALMPPFARARVCRSVVSAPPKQQVSPVTENRTTQFASRDGSAPSSSAGFEDSNMMMKRKIEELEAALAEAKRSKSG